MAKIDELNTELQQYIVEAESIKSKVKAVAENKDISIVRGEDTPDSVLDKINSGTIKTPTETIEITSNGSVDVTNYSSADVNVSPNLQDKSVEITTNETTTIVADAGYDGLNSVEVTTNVSGGGDYNVESVLNADGTQTLVINSVENPNPTTYVRPSDWLPIPEMDGTQDEIYILNGVALNGINIIAFQLSGSGTIDWGDGTSEAVSGNNVTYTHIYDYNSIPANTWTEHNKTRQVLIHISGNRGEITGFSGSVAYSYTNTDGNRSIIDKGVSNLVYDITANVERASVIVGANSFKRYQNLEIFDWKGSITNTGMSNMFYYCYSLQTIPQLDTSSVTDMSYMFSFCYSLISIPQLDTSSVINMQYMFNSCYSLISIPQLDTSNVTNMSTMFKYCYSLQSIPQLDTSSVTNMSSMFEYCSTLQTIPQLDTSNVTNMNSMFEYCSTLQSIPQLDTSNVTDMSYMFNSCYSLISIPQLDTSNVTNMSTMFSYCSILQSIPQLDTSSVTNVSTMFNNCYSLQFAKIFNLNLNYTSALTLSNLTNSKLMTKQALVDLFNSIAVNVDGYTRKIQLGTTLQGYLADCYVKDSGQLYTAIMPTNDTEIDTSKTYYTYDEKTDTYTEVVPDFTSDTFYYELKTATWNRYDICESTDNGAMLAINFVTNIKGYTIS